ncbi:MAG TPA: hypothetical protein VFP54_07225 [Acidimicrobiales bacterium]|nr:hypothetical protein [Acidimicrobiales bacterium]
MAALVMMVLAVPAAGAQTTTTSPAPTPGLSPTTPTAHGYFEYHASAGQTVDGAVKVGNPGPGAATFVLYPADGLTSQATGVVYSNRGVALTSTGTWIRLSRSSVDLGPGASATVPFQVVVPPGAYSGDHVAAIVAENPAAARSGGGGGPGAGVALKINTRVVLAVVVTVPGPASTALQLGRPGIAEQSGTRQVVTIPMDDTGQLLFKPRLVASVTGCTGTPEASFDRQLDTFVPHTSIVYQWSLQPKILPQGCYKLTATVFGGATPLSTTSDQVQVNGAVAAVNPAGPGPRSPLVVGVKKAKSPSMILGLMGGVALALLILVIAAIIFFLLGRRRREREEEEELAPQRV